jgi:hypothetical protein
MVVGANPTNCINKHNNKSWNNNMAGWLFALDLMATDAEPPGTHQTCGAVVVPAEILLSCRGEERRRLFNIFHRIS